MDIAGSRVSVMGEGKSHTTKPSSDKNQRAQNKDRCYQESNSKEPDMINMDGLKCAMRKASF